MYCSAAEIESLTDDEVNDYLITWVVVHDNSRPLTVLEIDKFLIFLIEKNRRTKDEKVKLTPARLPSKFTNARTCILYAIGPFLKIFNSIRVHVNLHGFESDSIFTEINSTILFQLSRLMCFAIYCYTEHYSQINIKLSSEGSFLKLSMCFTPTHQARTWILLNADSESERIEVNDFVYDNTYLMLAYVKQINGKLDAERNPDGTMCVQLQLLI